ncbi:MAG: hypothetical protein ACRDRU_12180 [Pseudonocardiaceae bacterium]
MIAWIGTGPRRRGAADDVREPDLRPPAGARPARNIAAGVALLCGAVLAVTATAAEGVLGPHDATTTPVIPKAGPDRAAPPVLAQVDRDMVVSPVPPAALPPLVRQAPKSIPVPPATVAEAAVPVAAPPAAAKPAATTRATVPPGTAPAAPDVETQPDASAQRRFTSRPDDTQTSRSAPSDQTAPPHRGWDRESDSGGLGATVSRTAESLASTLGLR